MTQWLPPVFAVLALTTLLGTALVLAGHWLQVHEAPRVGAVEALLPGANCGACGYPGCAPFAEALAKGEAEPAQCTVSDAAGRASLAAYLGVQEGQVVRRVARLACAGGTQVARSRAEYRGIASCAGAAAVAGGTKGCPWGCLGYGDCEQACDFQAIAMNLHRLPVVEEPRCTACGDCVSACPKDLFSLVREEVGLFVRCNSHERGQLALEHCEVGCDAGGRCAKDAPEGVRMHRNLPLVSATPALPCRQAIDRCPTGAIVFFEPGRGPLVGRQARAIVRKEPRPMAPYQPPQSLFSGGKPPA